MNIYDLLPRKKRIFLKVLLFMLLFLVVSFMVLLPLSFFFPIAQTIFDIIADIGSIFGILCCVYVIKNSIQWRWWWLLAIGVVTLGFNVFSLVYL